ncbi:hypothetical protein N8870_05440 [Alphaproteobacteria bacterium]|nr:hypothetical protein [Alphaproteobacteria bacterium]
MPVNKKIIMFIFHVFLFSYINIFPVFGDQSDEENTFLTKSQFKDLIKDVKPMALRCSSLQDNERSQQWFYLVKKIKLSLNARKYFKNIRKKLTSSNLSVSNNIERKWTEYRKAKIQLNGSDCEHKASYRLTGDLLDHVNYDVFGELKAFPHSVKVKLKNTSIDNIKKFKLFVPKSREGKFEILNVLLHKKIGFLAPRTALIDLQIGGETYKAIFQEDISKELLEHNNFHEAIIIKGDEGYHPFANPRISSQKLISSPYFKKISTNILKIISPSFFLTANTNISTNHDTPLLIDFLPLNSKEENIHFHLLNFALKNQQGLTTDDHRFFYDHISQKFLPIYYDGHHNERGYENVNFNFTKQNQDYVINKIENLDIKELIDEAKKLGVIVSTKEMKSIIVNALNYLKKLTPAAKIISDKEPINSINWKKYIDEGSLVLLSQYNLKNIKISWLPEINKLTTCNISKNDSVCETDIISNELFTKNYPFQPQSAEKGIFLHRPIKLNNQSVSYTPKLKKHLFKKTGTIIEYTENINVKINKDKKLIYFKKKNMDEFTSIKEYERVVEEKTSQIKISGGEIKNWNFVISKNLELGYKQDGISRASKLGLTGCITFSDIKVQDISLVIEDTNCEDGLHFVRVTGNIRNVSIINSYSDAIDADFSILAFENINIENAGNDCIDLSQGKYLIKNMTNTKCGDKGVSAGEKSFVTLNNVKVNTAAIAIASKDSSIINIKKANINNSKVCLASYRKKQEFRKGQIIFGPALNCNKIPSYIQKFSNL